MKTSTRVVATEEITEENFPHAGAPTHVHARKGERGTVVHVEDDVFTVRWDRSGTATAVDHEPGGNVRLIADHARA